MEESEGKDDLPGTAKALAPLAPGLNLSQLEDVIESGCTPKINVRFHPIPASPLIKFLVIEVEPKPTQVMVLLGDDRYYIRRNYRRGRMTPEDLERAFRRVARTRDHVNNVLTSRDFEHLKAVPEPYQYYLAIPHVDEPYLIDSRGDSARMKDVIEDAFLEDLQYNSIQPSAVGYEMVAKDATGTHFVCRIWRSGIFKFGDTISGQNKTIWAGPALMGALQCVYTTHKLYSAVGYHHPVEVVLGWRNIGGCSIPTEHSRVPKTSDRTEAIARLAVTWTDLQRRPRAKVQELFNLIWQHFGEDKCSLFNPDGSIKVPPHPTGLAPFRDWLQRVAQGDL